MAKTKTTEGPYWSKAWIQQLWEFTNQNFVNFDTGAVDFEGLGREEFEFRKAMFFRNFKNSKRAEIAFEEACVGYNASKQNGSKGGRPTKDKQDAPPTKTPSKPEPMPKMKETVIYWAQDHGIDMDDAGECWEATMERNGRDGDGKFITNWKGFVTQWCKTRKENRK